VSWAVLSRARTAAALVSAMSTRVDAGTMAAAGGCSVLGPNGCGADVREVDKCRRWDYGGGRGGGGSASVGEVDRSQGDDSGGGRSLDLHVNKGVGDVVGAVVRDSGRVRLERVHVASRVREGDVPRVVTLLLSS
jgi:hypothetical protein